MLYGNSPKLLWIGVGLPVTDLRIVRALESVEVFAESSLQDGLNRLASGEFAVAVLSVSSFRSADQSALEQILRQDPRFPVIVHDAAGTLDDALSLTRRGAFYVLLGDIDAQRLENAVKMALERRNAQASLEVDTLPWRRLVIGRSRAMQRICEVIQLIASKRCTVLIGGETGTGKEVIAKAIHAAGNRAARAMVSVNCTALPANLIETELFGHAKGAFTGASGSRIGRFEQANRSTIFLDEIGDLPLDAQAKLLRVLQEQEFQRVGSSETVRVDVRVLAASNVDLEQAVQQRRFREDLFYRLNVVPIRIPPLRDRREDIPLLLDHFLDKIHAAEGGAAKRISPQALEFLMSLDWPGNVRQLEHSVQMAFALTGDREVLHPGDFSSCGSSLTIAAASPQQHHQQIPAVPSEGLDFDEVVSRFELSLLSQALAASGGNKARAADLLRIKRTTLLAKMKSLGLAQAPSSAAPQSGDLDNCTEAQSGISDRRKKPGRAASRPVALIFEPEAPTRKLVSRTLEEEGYKVLEATTAATALDLVQCWRSYIGLLVVRMDSSRAGSDFLASLRNLECYAPLLLLSEDDCAYRTNPSQQARVLVCPFSQQDVLFSLKQLSLISSLALPDTSCA